MTGAEQILGLKSWEMLLQLLASHRQSQATLDEAVAWAKNVFQKRALEKHLLAGDCGHIFLMFPLLAFLPSRALAAMEGRDGEDCLAVP